MGAATGLHQLDSPHASQAGATVTSPDANGDARTAIQSAYQREQQRRTFWLLYCLDRHLALSYNREPLLVDGEHFVFQPLSEDQWQSLGTRSTDSIALAERQQGPFLVITGKGATGRRDHHSTPQKPPSHHSKQPCRIRGVGCTTPRTLRQEHCEPWPPYQDHSVDSTSNAPAITIRGRSYSRFCNFT
jgi:hypothetical protein